jgi:hypothetical protein
MTEHDKIEHPLPNGDVLIQDSTRTRPDVEAAFRKIEVDFEREAEQAPTASYAKPPQPEPHLSVARTAATSANRIAPPHPGEG